MADRGRMPLLHLRISQALLDEIAALVPAVQRHLELQGRHRHPARRAAAGDQPWDRGRAAGGRRRERS